MTERTIRTEGKWAKITRSDDGSWCIARGFAGRPKAFDLAFYPKDYGMVWSLALQFAKQQLDDLA